MRRKFRLKKMADSFIENNILAVFLFVTIGVVIYTSVILGSYEGD